MVRAEIISNQSVEDDVLELLENMIPQIQYTVIPNVHGRGLTSKKLGDTVWPEQNFVLFSFVSEDDAKKIKSAIQNLKQKFPNEGISVFFTKTEEI